MVSATGILEQMDKRKLIVVIAGLLVVMLLGSLAIWALTPRVESRELERSGRYAEAEPTPEGVKKSDSDHRQIGDVLVDWPDKLSDIEENYIYGTDYRQPDSDQDGMEDGWEALYSRPNPITERLTIDPNSPDWAENPDGDGFDLNNNGVVDDDEELTNLREYADGAKFNFTTMTFEEGELVFGGLDPKVEWQEIGMRGGFHLYDDPVDNAEGQVDTDLTDDYLRYNPYYPEIYKPVTTNPSLWDTDQDGMDDGWETHYRRVFQSQLFDATGTLVKEGTIDDLQEAFPTTPKRVLVVTSFLSVDWTKNLIDPLNPVDSDYDMDVRVGYSLGLSGKEPIYIFYPDDLTNLQEYEYHTSPLLWDTDGDSNFNAITKELQLLHDKIEVGVNYTKSAVDWNGDGVLDYRTCPYISDTDGDGMGDGWELQTGLDPLNSTDRFKDQDNDGLPNYLENAFPNKENLWFTTDPMDPDTDRDGMYDGWEAYKAKIISRQDALNSNDDLLDKIPDSKRTIFTVSPMVQDADEDNDGIWNITQGGLTEYTRVPDGMTNIEEYLGTVQYPVSTNPNEPDTDLDGLLDGEELKNGYFGELIGGNYFTDPEIALIYYTNATLADSDNDGGGSERIQQVSNSSRRLDDWEETRGRTKYILEQNGLDDDGDGFVDEEEGEILLFEPTNATNPDTDLDGWMDVDELFGIDTTLLWERSKMGIIKTNPNKRDTDNDQMGDFDELIRIPNYREWITDPNDPDTDNDGMEDGLENEVDFFPLIDWNRRDNWDANDDGDFSDTELGDIYSTKDRTNPTKFDSDDDTIPDGWEYRWGKIIKGDDTRAMILEYDRSHSTSYWTQLPKGGHFWIVNPLMSADVYEDPDHDDLNNFEEYKNGTDPLRWDTDGDGMPDGWELRPDIRGSPIFDPEISKYVYILDPLDPTDWALDADHDGYVYSIWTPTNAQKTDFELVKYYFPFINLYEYRTGLDPDKDGINEITTTPAPRVPDYGVMGGYDTDGDKMPDGWEIWVTDFISNLSDISQFEDADGLPRGWEELYNGSMWNKPECYVFEDKNGTWDPWLDSLEMKNKKNDERRVFQPAGYRDNAEYYIGRFYPDRKDTNLNGLTDDAEDYDSDGPNNDNHAEYRYHTDPTDRDSYPGAAGGKIPGPKQGPGRASMVEPVEEIEPMLVTVPYETPEVRVQIESVQEVLSSIGILMDEPRLAIVTTADKT